MPWKLIETTLMKSFHDFEFQNITLLALRNVINFVVTLTFFEPTIIFE